MRPISADNSRAARRFLATALSVVFLACAWKATAFPSSQSQGAGKDAFPRAVSELFPDIEGWKKDGAPKRYYPETLFDYIDGGADLYLSYDFVELAAQVYESPGGSSLSIDVYAHESIEDAFGIYSTERSPSAEFLEVGNEGYYDPGILNFYQGGFYVKLMAFGVEEGEKEFLEKVAHLVSERLGKVPEPPSLLRCLPVEGKVPESEGYIARDFLGHGFLRNVFVAQYELEEGGTGGGAGAAGTGTPAEGAVRDTGGPVELFIMEGTGGRNAREIAARYAELAGSEAPDTTATSGSLSLIDPYNESRGPLLLRWKGRYMWGVFGGGSRAAERLLEAVDACIDSTGRYQLKGR